jgi:hypothetical protein
VLFGGVVATPHFEPHPRWIRLVQADRLELLPRPLANNTQQRELHLAHVRLRICPATTTASASWPHRKQLRAASRVLPSLPPSMRILERSELFRAHESGRTELQNQYSNYKAALQQLASKIGDVEQEAEEHKSVPPPSIVIYPSSTPTRGCGLLASFQNVLRTSVHRQRCFMPITSA